MAVELYLDETAEEELRAAYLWYLERNPVVAEAFSREIEYAFARIAEGPQHWARQSASTRGYVLPRFPFTVVYRELVEHVQILAVAHQKRKPGYWKK